MGINTNLRPCCLLCKDFDYRDTTSTLYADDLPVTREILIYCSHQKVCEMYDAKNRGIAINTLELKD